QHDAGLHRDQHVPEALGGERPAVRGAARPLDRARVRPPCGTEPPAALVHAAGPGGVDPATGAALKDRPEIRSPRAPRARPSAASGEWGTPAGFARRGRGAEPLAI